MATLVKLRKLTADERRELERLARSRAEEARLVVRARIVLGLADGQRPYQVADRVGVGRMVGRGRRQTSPASRSQRRTVSRPTVTR